MTHTGDSPRVLVVDDDTSLTGFLKDFLGQRQYQMLTALDGPTALRLIETQQPTLVLLDMKLPGLDGATILRDLRTRFPHIKVIVMTSYDEEYERLCQELRTEGFFAKPLSLVALGARIEEVLAAPHNPGPSAQVGAPVVEQWTPQAKLLIVGGQPFRPIRLCISAEDDLRPDEDELDSALAPFAGRYEIQNTVSADEALKQLRTFGPDIVLIAADFSDEPRKSRQPRITAAQIAQEILQSKWKPKEILLFGAQNLPATGAGTSPTILEEPDIALFGQEEFIEKAVQISRILRDTCVRLGLVTRRDYHAS